MLQMAMVASSVVAADEGVLRLRSVRMLPAAEGPATPTKEADDRAGQETGPTGGLREERWLQSGRTEKAAGGVAAGEGSRWRCRQAPRAGEERGGRRRN